MVLEVTEEIMIWIGTLLNQIRKTKVLRTLSQTQPRCFIDNHVSNGADYQYKLTYIMTQNQLGTVLGTFLDTEMMPSIVLDLQKKILKLRLT
jgi:hypothetical protein